MNKIFLTAVTGLLACIAASAQCSPSQVPYVQNFEEAIVPSMPECTSAYMGTFIGNNWETGIMQTEGSSNTLLQFNTETDETEGLMADFNTNRVNLQAGVQYKISFRYGNTNPEGVISNFSVSLANWGNQMTTVTYMENLSESGEFATGPFSINTSGIYYLTFNIMCGNHQGVFFLDDIVIEEWGCIAPEGLAVSNITETTADLNWTDNDAPNFEYVIVPAGEDPGIGIGNTAAAVTVDELEPGTEYTVYVRGYCFDSWSIWSQGVNFTTLGVAGIGDNRLERLQVYPNPVKDMVNISYTEPVDTITIYNALGQAVHSQSFSASQISVNLDKLSAGTYFMTVYSGQRSDRLKILKE